MNPHQRCLQAKVKYQNEPKQVMPKSEDLSRSLEINAIWTFDMEFPTIFNKSSFSGMDEEASVSFHEHIFLEPLLEPFPRKGPIRHFMELVITGLSKNPHMSVTEKREHVMWFRDYFQEKKSVLDETIQM